MLSNHSIPSSRTIRPCGGQWMGQWRTMTGWNSSPLRGLKFFVRSRPTPAKFNPHPQEFKNSCPLPPRTRRLLTRTHPAGPLNTHSLRTVSVPNLHQSLCVGKPPFNDHQNHYNGSCFFCYNLPDANAREVFKPTTDAGSLLGSIKKKNFWFGWGVRLGEARKIGVFSFFDQLWRALDASPMDQNFGSNFF